MITPSHFPFVFRNKIDLIFIYDKSGLNEVPPYYMGSRLGKFKGTKNCNTVVNINNGLCFSIL